ncbi:hypothetical protein CSUI_007905 [Cystoisospora suis]|uniref:Uncharacterized protein n=1 Tax=Cystoisospora suis TaxID=483139 RepID=A0A2C6KPF5_9APIC|nr:hypothetical protein CSUI_007905 [Cystoisospora suis]
MYTTLLDRVKTYSGRYGFHNRSIAALDQLRRNYVELRTNPETHAKVWDDMKIAASAYDDYKAFAYTEELKQGVAAGIWPAHTLPLFLY